MAAMWDVAAILWHLAEKILLDVFCLTVLPSFHDYVGETALNLQIAAVLLLVELKISRSLLKRMLPVMMNSQQCLNEEMQSVPVFVVPLPYVEQRFKC